MICHNREQDADIELLTSPFIVSGHFWRPHRVALLCDKCAAKWFDEDRETERRNYLAMFPPND